MDGLSESDDKIGSVPRHCGEEYGPTIDAEVLVNFTSALGIYVAQCSVLVFISKSAIVSDWRWRRIS